MNSIIIYGSQYGSTRRYAEKLSELTSIPAVSFKESPHISGQDTIIYMGGLYAGGVLGLSKTLRSISPQEIRRLFIVTVGLSDPSKPETTENVHKSLQKQLSSELFQHAKLFHLRGAMDNGELHLGHRTAMALLYQSLRRMPSEKWTEEDRALMDTYGKQVDFVDFEALEPVIRELNKESI